MFVPNDGFLNSNKPLLNDCEVMLSFDRAAMDAAFIKVAEVTPDQKGKVLEISNCFALTEYISSESLRRQFSKIDSNPLTYTYKLRSDS